MCSFQLSSSWELQTLQTRCGRPISPSWQDTSEEGLSEKRDRCSDTEGEREYGTGGLNRARIIWGRIRNTKGLWESDMETKPYKLLNICTNIHEIKWSCHVPKRSLASLLDYACQQIKTPIPGMGYLFSNCWPMGSQRPPNIIGQYHCFCYSQDLDSKTLLLKHYTCEPQNMETLSWN